MVGGDVASATAGFRVERESFIVESLREQGRDLLCLASVIRMSRSVIGLLASVAINRLEFQVPADLSIGHQPETAVAGCIRDIKDAQRSLRGSSQLAEQVVASFDLGWPVASAATATVRVRWLTA